MFPFAPFTLLALHNGFSLFAYLLLAKPLFVSTNAFPPKLLSCDGDANHDVSEPLL